MHVYKCLNGLINHELTLVTHQHLHNYNTRNKVNLRLPCVKRNWGKQRTAHHAVNDFYSLSEMIRDSANVNIFKRQVYNNLIKCFINFIFLVFLDILVHNLNFRGPGDFETAECSTF